VRNPFRSMVLYYNSAYSSFLSVNSSRGYGTISSLKIELNEFGLVLEKIENSNL